MSKTDVPTLSSIVDQLTARIEGIEQTGDPVELQLLQDVRGELVDFALRDSHQKALIQDVLARVREAS